jgi:hypothetical protein
VTDTDEGTQVPPTGKVSFAIVGGAQLGECELSGTQPTRSCSVQYEPTATGSPEVEATYEGDESHAVSEKAIAPVSVTARATTLSVSCGAGVVVSQSATCTATVTDAAEGKRSSPTGAVTFATDTAGASFGLEHTCTLTPLASGSRSACSLEYKPAQVGSGMHTITASYGGDATHTPAGGEGKLPVSAPAVSTPSPGATAPPAAVTTTPAPTPTPTPTPVVSPPRPTCRVVAKQRWSSVTRRKRPHRVEVPTLLVTYTCDQSATVRIGGTVTIAATRRGGKVKRARTIDLMPASSTAAAGRAQPAALALPASAATALRSAVRTGVVVTFKVSNANGSGAATIRFLLTPPPHTSS